MSYRPICDTWFCVRSKVKYYGAYPAGFLERARVLVCANINDPVLHVCGGQAKYYPYKGGFGPNDRTMDLDVNLYPDFHHDARVGPYPLVPRTKKESSDAADQRRWRALIADPPYTEADADKYAPKRGAFPTPRVILAHMLDAVEIGGKVGILHYVAPRPPQNSIKDGRVKFIASITVDVGFENRPRKFSVFERRK